MTFFTAGNVVTLGICLFLVILFRQMDKNNRSIEKAKKFGDKLKDELDSFVRERTGKLDEAKISIEVQLTQAVASVKKLESIRTEFLKKEETLLDRTHSVDSFGKQIEAYDSTIKQLMEMTALAETNLTRISSESEFADNLGKKLLVAKKQLDDVSSAIPELTARFTRENADQLSAIKTETLERISGTIQTLEHRVSTAEQHGSELLATGTEKLKEIYQKAFTEASRKADNLEDASFVKLKEQASERLVKYRDTVEEKTNALHEQTKEKLHETQQLVKSFKSDWQSEASDLLETARAEIRELTSLQETTASHLSDEFKSAEALASSRADDIQKELELLSKTLDKKVQDTGDGVSRNIAAINSQIDSYRKDIDYRVGQFDSFIGDAERLEQQLRLAMQETEKRVTGDFSLYTQDQQARQDSFEKKIILESETVSGRMTNLENGLNELKSRAYDNVSSKLKMFEDDFFADLAKRSDAITAALDSWKGNVDERLAALSSETEATRKDAEDAYTTELKDRLASIGDQYRQQTGRLEEQIASVEAELRTRITASDQSILAFVEQYRAEFAQARQAAQIHVENEIQAHGLMVQEMLRKQEREVDARTKEFINTIEAAKTESGTFLAGIRSDYSSWQARNEQQLSDARTLLDEKVAALGSSADSSIAELESVWQTKYRDFAAKTADERKQLKDSVDGLKTDITAATADFDMRSKDALAEFTGAYENLAAETARRIRESGAETDLAVRNIRTTVQEIRESVESTREKLFQKLQSDTGNLGQTIEEIDRKQKAFIAQTRVFERADELKNALDTGIESLKGELSRLDVYRDTMNTLEQQYGKIRKLEEETSQKVSRFMSDKKRIEILETDFNKLLALSDNIDKKISELTLTNDDLQQYQIQIRRFEETVAEVNSRYERLEKKAVVLDQTVSGVDKAFDQLKEFESALQSYRSQMTAIPAELGSLKTDLSSLLENKSRTSEMVEKLSALDDILEDVEKRTVKMQTAREWLGRTETRLEDISKQSQDQLKLLGDLLKEDGPAKKAKGAPPMGIRENVVKLAHQGWKVDEIARVLHLSRGEVELILELPSK